MKKIKCSGDKLNDDPLLMIPGPTIVPSRITRAMSMPILPHRGKAFSKLFLEQTERLKSVFKTKNDIFILCGSGTAAMEAAISNTIEEGDKVLCLVNGKFSERFTEIAIGFGADTMILEFEWGRSIDVSMVKKVLEKNQGIKAITMVFNETSTGVRNPVKEIGDLVKDTDTLLIVDTISALGGDVFKTDEWNVDICASGSQKCFALPPGLAFISVSHKAWDVINNTNGKCYYLDLERYKKDKSHAPYTPPVTLVYGLKEALDIFDEEGIEKRWERHRALSSLVREEIKNMGLELFPVSEDICSQTVTAVKVPEDVDEGMMRSIMRDKYNIVIAGGQAHLKGKIFRIGHMGVVQEKDILSTLCCLKKALQTART